MKRIWIPIVVLVLVCALSTAGLAATTIKDVSPSHWAYQSVNKLIDEGYLSLYEDSTFRGDKTVTRYQLAEILARILEGVGEGNVTAAEGDVATMRALAVELRDELVKVVDKQGVFAKRLQQLEGNQVIIKEDMARSQQQVLEIIDQLIKLKELEAKYDELTGQMADLETNIAQVEKKLVGNIDQVSKDIEELKISFDQQIGDVQTTQQTNAEAIKALEEENELLKADIKDLEAKNSRMIYYLVGGLLLSLLIR